MMTIPLWVLLGFAAWTLLTLFLTVGVYRWIRILSGRTEIAYWRADESQGSEWYQRAVRAHLNCVENLPVLAAIIVILVVTGIDSPAIDALTIAILVARVLHTLVHLLFEQTNMISAIRFGFFFMQAACMIALIIIIGVTATT